MNQLGYALITGASGGIGECFARSLAPRGYDLVLAARSKDKLELLADELQKKNQIRVTPISVDLSLHEGVATLVNELRKGGIEVTLLVNNAGFGARGRFWELSLERQAEMIRLNIQALVELTYLLLPDMISKRTGAIINVSSTASFQPVPYTTTYAATKAFVTSFSEALAEELKPYGVRVVTLCPGGTETNFFAAGQYGMSTMLGGLQSPQEVVDAALKGLDRGSGLVVPRLLNKLMVASERLVPRSLVIKAAARMFRV
jgi:short-subunit dehydrogenase